MTDPDKVRIAYFSMEIAASAEFPTYAGGLGILAGDTLRSAADLSVAIVAVTLLHRKGYFRQRLDPQGRQSEDTQEWEPEQVLEPVEPLVSVELAGRTVKVRAWRHEITGVTGGRVRVYFLDTKLPENSTWERTLTDCLYGGDPIYRLCQEAVLGIAGIRELFDRHIPEWRHDNLYLRYAIGIDLREIQEAHQKAKAQLLQEIQGTTGVSLSESVATLGFARRAAEYKRADLLFADLNRLIRRNAGPFQIVFGGKAHPQDEAGKAVIRRVFEAASALRDSIPIVYIPDYDIRWARLFTSGVDLWLNTPHRPLEASGTSGMKAALNGVPSLSVRNGWWVEGHFEGVTGWSIGYDEDPEEHAVELASLYEKLEHTVLPMFYSEPQAYAQIMRSAIVVNGSFLIPSAWSPNTC